MQPNLLSFTHELTKTARIFGSSVPDDGDYAEIPYEERLGNHKAHVIAKAGEEPTGYLKAMGIGALLTGGLGALLGALGGKPHAALLGALGGAGAGTLGGALAAAVDDSNVSGARKAHASGDYKTHFQDSVGSRRRWQEFGESMDRLNRDRRLDDLERENRFAKRGSAMQAMEQPAMGTGKGVKKKRMKKMADNYAGLGGALGPIGAALGAEDGRGWQAAGGSLAGGMAGSKLSDIANLILQAVTKKKTSAATQLAMSRVGAVGGSMIGGHLLGKKSQRMRDLEAREREVHQRKHASDESEPSTQDMLSEMLAQAQYQPEPEQPFWADQGSTMQEGVEEYGHGKGLGKRQTAPKRAPFDLSTIPARKPKSVPSRPQPQPQRLPDVKQNPGPRPVPVRKEKLRVASVDKTAAIAARFFGNFGKQADSRNTFVGSRSEQARAPRPLITRPAPPKQVISLADARAPMAISPSNAAAGGIGRPPTPTPPKPVVGGKQMAPLKPVVPAAPKPPPKNVAMQNAADDM